MRDSLLPVTNMQGSRGASSSANTLIAPSPPRQMTRLDFQYKNDKEKTEFILVNLCNPEGNDAPNFQTELEKIDA